MNAAAAPARPAIDACRRRCRRCGGCASSAIATNPACSWPRSFSRLLAALPDALLALWFKLLGEGVLEGDRGLVRMAAVALGVSAAATWFLRTVSTRVQRALPRQGDDRARGARRPAPGVGGDHRPPGAARLPRPAGNAAQPGVRARPHVHVAVLHLRVDSAPGRDGRAPRCRSTRLSRCSPCSRCPRCSHRRGGPRSSARPRSAALGRAAWPATCSPRPPPRRPARRCA